MYACSMMRCCISQIFSLVKSSSPYFLFGCMTLLIHYNTTRNIAHSIIDYKTIIDYVKKSFIICHMLVLAPRTLNYKKSPPCAIWKLFWRFVHHTILQAISANGYQTLPLRGLCITKNWHAYSSNQESNNSPPHFITRSVLHWQWVYQTKH